MRILITGGAGFIGSHVADALIDAGHEVAVVDNFSTGKKENIPKAVSEVFEGDVTDAPWLAEVVAKYQPDVVNHHAAQISVTVSERDPMTDAIHNVIGKLSVLEAVRALDKRVKLIYASSGGAMYGAAEPGVPFTEESPTRPLSPYGLSKNIAEQYAWLYNRMYGVPTIVLRYSNVYGPRQNPHGEAGVCAIFSDRMSRGDECRIFGDGNQVRDYVFVKDVAAANVAALLYEGDDYFNICTGNPVTTKEVFDTFARHFKYTLPVVLAPERKGDLPYSLLDGSKAANALGWKSSVDFNEGSRQTAQWYTNDN
jgi:UDP-glucose 4-epimerase